MEAYLNALLASAISAGISTSPIFVLAAWKRSPKIARTATLAFLLFLLDGAAVHFPQLLGMTGIAWAVSGKFLQLLVFFLICKKLVKSSLVGAPKRNWAIWAPIIAFVTLIPSFFMPENLPPRMPSLEWGLYQATLPGLAEEFIYRGVILFLLDEALGRPLGFLGTKWGWGALVTSVHFYLAHCLALNETSGVEVVWTALPDFALYGFCMCWLRYRFESIWPCVLAHNLHNLTLIFSPLVIKTS